MKARHVMVAVAAATLVLAALGCAGKTNQSKLPGAV